MAHKINPFKAFASITIVPDFLLSRREISPTSKLLYGRLCWYHGKNGPAYPGVQRLADDLGVQKRHIYRCLDELKESGLIQVTNRKASSLTSIYEFLEHPWMYARAGLLAAPGAGSCTSPGDVTSPGAEGAPGDVSDTSPGVLNRGNVRPIATKRRNSASIPPGVISTPGDVHDTTQVSFQGRVAAEPGAQSGTTQVSSPGLENSPPKQKMAPIASVAFRAGAQSGTSQVSQTSRPGVPNDAEQVSFRTKPSIQGREDLKRGREEKGGPRFSPPLIISIRPEDADAVSEVLAVYDRAHVRLLRRHYIASEQQDAEAALWAWQKATAIAEQELAEKGKDESELGALRTRVLEHWSRKLLTDRDYVASKGFGFWTIRSMITQLGTPFSVGRHGEGPGIAKPPAPRMSPQELGVEWGKALEQVRIHKCYGDIGG